MRAATRVALCSAVLLSAFAQADLAAGKAEDFTLRDTCEGYFVNFTDGDADSAAADQCDGGSQEGDNTLLYSSGWTVDAGDVPAASRNGADSMYHDNTIYSCPVATNLDQNFDDMTIVGFWRSDAAKTDGLRTRKGSGAWLYGEFATLCNVTPEQKARGHETYQSTAGPACPAETWIYQGASWDSQDTGTVKTFGSQSTNAGSLFDCTGGGLPENCNAEVSAPQGLKDFALGCSSSLGNRYQGNVMGVAFFSEILTPQEHCEICRYDVDGRNSGRGRVDFCKGGGQRCGTRAWRNRGRRVF